MLKFSSTSVNVSHGMTNSSPPPLSISLSLSHTHTHTHTHTKDIIPRDANTRVWETFWMSKLLTFYTEVNTFLIWVTWSADKTKYMVMSRDQNAGRIHSVRIDNTTFERVEEFKYLGTTLTNQNYIAEEIQSRLSSGNACYHSVQNLLSSRLLSKNLKIKIYRTTRVIQ